MESPFGLVTSISKSKKLGLAPPTAACELGSVLSARYFAPEAYVRSFLARRSPLPLRATTPGEGAHCGRPRDATPGGRTPATRRSDSATHDWGREPVNAELSYCDNPPRKIPYYRLNQSTLVIKR
jgi:hypothetical protein